MKSEAEATTSLRMHDTNILADDCYLSEMTERLRRLRSLVTEQETRKKPKKGKPNKSRTTVKF